MSQQDLYKNLRQQKIELRYDELKSYIKILQQHLQKEVSKMDSALALQSLTSWTDDLPVCRASGIGVATNEISRRDGRRADMHPLEDRSFHFSVDEFGLCVYGLFDGFGGSQVADFASKKFPAELLLGQLSSSISDEGIRSILRQAFESIDGEYFSTIGEYLAKRMVMRFDQRVRPDDPTLLKLDAKTVCGASCAVAVLLNETKLFVASVGDTRAVVCSLRPEGNLKALPLTIDHVIGSNEDEALRLSQLGIDIGSAIAALGSGTNPGYTRCLGHHRVKGGYKEIDLLSKIENEPVLAEPEIHGGFEIQMHHLFLLVYTKPLADCMEAIMGNREKHSSTDVSTELCKITLDQFSENTTVSGVAQSVVDKVVRMHREVFETSPGGLDTLSREDLTLLVRNFHANLSSRRLSGHYPGSNNQDNYESNTITSSDLGQGSSVTDGTDKTRSGRISDEDGVELRRKGPRSSMDSRTTTNSDMFVKQNSGGGNDLDENGRIKAYVDFSHFHREWNKVHSQTPQQISRQNQNSSHPGMSHNGI